MPEDLNDKFVAFLKNNGYLVTRQRRRIGEIIFSSDGHLSVDDIQALLRKNRVSASVASIYRTLDVLLKSGLVIQHRFGKRFKRFESVRRKVHHDHLVCIRCGKVREFKNRDIERLQDQVADGHGFQITDHKLVLYGLCGNCRDKT